MGVGGPNQRRSGRPDSVGACHSVEFSGHQRTDGTGCRERITSLGKAGEPANDPAASHNKRGDALCDQGKLDEAIKEYEKAIEIYTRLVDEEGQAELANDLAASHNKRGYALGEREKPDEAIRDYQKAIEIYTRLVHEEGRADLAS
ncbi:MAG: tetratricopeptide repeat protein, partial [Planctomycetota bacterium]